MSVLYAAYMSHFHFFFCFMDRPTIWSKWNEKAVLSLSVLPLFRSSRPVMARLPLSSFLRQTEPRQFPLSSTLFLINISLVRRPVPVAETCRTRHSLSALNIQVNLPFQFLVVFLSLLFFLSKDKFLHEKKNENVVANATFRSGG